MISKMHSRFWRRVMLILYLLFSPLVFGVVILLLSWVQLQEAWNETFCWSEIKRIWREEKP